VGGSASLRSRRLRSPRERRQDVAPGIALSGYSM
jgi:hypothetical protein